MMIGLLASDDVYNDVEHDAYDDVADDDDDAVDV